MRMIRLAGLGVILMLMASGMSVHAQDETPPPCDIDLSDTAALLVQAQAAASSGETDTALDTLAAVRAELDAIEAACGDDETPAVTQSAAAELAPPDGYQVYEAPDGDFAFAYPQDWTQFTENGTVFTGTSEAAATAITRGASTLTGTEQGAAVVVGTPPELVASAAADATPGDIADVYRATLDDLGFDADDVTETTIQGETGAQVTFSAPGYDGLLLTFPIPDTSTFGLVMASAAPDQREALESITRTIAESITVQSSE